MPPGSGGEDYDVITARGQTINISSGQTWSNKLIDVSGGGGFTIFTRGATNWTLRNIGVKGYYTGGSFIISGTDGSSGGHSLVENLYLADGASKSGASFVHGPGAIFIGPSGQHRGHITFRYCNVQGYPNNGFYCSNGPGSVKFENCLAANNGVSNFRCGSTPGDEIRNCVAYNTNKDYGWYHRRYSYVEDDGRPLWMWGPGSVNVYNTHMTNGTYPATLYERGGGQINYISGAVSGGTGGASIGSNVGSNPDLSPPEGVPLTPEQAASGGGGGDGGGGPPPDPDPTPPSDGDGDDGDGGDSDPPEEDPYDGDYWTQPTPPSEPDSTDPMTGISFHNVTDPELIEIYNSDFTWLGDGKVARTREDGSGTFRACRFRGDEPDADDIIEEDGG